MSVRPPGPLVDPEWLEHRLGDERVVVLEVDEQPLIYTRGHIPGARNVDWHRDLQDPISRDIPGPEAMRQTWAGWGINRRSTVVLYGDKNNWYACFGYWLLQYYGLENLAILDGGRQRWLAEERPLEHVAPVVTRARAVPRPAADTSVRARWDEVRRGDAVLLDVRTPEEYSGELLTEPGYPQEVAQRPGHIPGASNAPWDIATGADGRFLEPSALRAIYAAHDAVNGRDVITYCRIGERSAHTWFVLHELLGLAHVLNYDGSWTEWGSMIGMPVALGMEPGEMPPS